MHKELEEIADGLEHSADALMHVELAERLRAIIARYSVDEDVAALLNRLRGIELRFPNDQYDAADLIERLSVERDEWRGIAAAYRHTNERLEEQLRPGSPTERAPTQEAYDLACAALHKHRERADQAEAELVKAQAEKQFWNCKTHGEAVNAWGCPECVRELRAELVKVNENWDRDISALDRAYKVRDKMQDLFDEALASNAILREALDKCSEVLCANGLSVEVKLPTPNDKATAMVRVIEAAKKAYVNLGSDRDRSYREIIDSTTKILDDALADMEGKK